MTLKQLREEKSASITYQTELLQMEHEEVKEELFKLTKLCYERGIILPTDFKNTL